MRAWLVLSLAVALAAPVSAATQTETAAPAPTGTEESAAQAQPPRSLSDSLAETHRRLSQRISVDYKEVALSKVLDDLAQQTNVRFSVSWDCIAFRRCDPNDAKAVRVSAKLTEVPVYKVLATVLEAASAWWNDRSAGSLAMVIDKNGTVRVSLSNSIYATPGCILPVPSATVTYEVKDLIPKQDVSDMNAKMPRETAALYKIWGAMAGIEPNKTVALSECKFAGTTLVIPGSPRIHTAVTAVLAGMRGQKVEEPSDPALRRKLALVVDAVDLYGISLTAALEFLQKEGDLNLRVDWESLKKFEVNEYTPLTSQRQQNVTLQRVVESAVESVKSKTGRLAWKTEKGEIVIYAERLSQPKASH
jgi:hypothetical protein